MRYRPRVVDARLTEALRSSGAVLVEGPQACGKTETSKRVAASVTSPAVLGVIMPGGYG